VEETHSRTGVAERRIYAAAALFVLILGAAVRGHALGRFSLGNDEIHEVRWSRLPWPEMLAAVREEGIHPPLDYFVQTLLDRSGVPEWARRLPSVIAGVLTLGLTMFLARRWFGPAAGIAGGLLLALSPIHVRYSQEVRPYALGLMFLVASLALLEAYRGKPRRAWAIGWFLCVLAAAYTLYFAGLIAALVSTAMIWAFRQTSLRPLWRALPLAVGGWIVLYSPWLPVVLSAARKTPSGVGRERLDAAWAASRLQTLGTGDWAIEPVSMGSWTFWLLVAAGLLLAARSRVAAVAAFWLVAGTVTQIAILQFRPHYPAARYLLPSWLAAILLAAAAAGWSRRPIAGVAALVALALILTFDVRTLGSYFREGRPQWRDVAAFLRERVQPGERLVAANSWAYRNLGYYWSEAGASPPVVPLERPPVEVAGPAWIVLALCPTTPDARAQLDGLPLVAEFPLTNHCQIRYVPAGRTARVQGICLGDSGDFRDAAGSEVGGGGGS
jgi:mannosyltransferase